MALKSVQDFREHVVTVADAWHDRAMRCAYTGRASVWYAPSVDDAGGGLAILPDHQSPGFPFVLARPGVIRGDMTREQVRATLEAIGRRLPLLAVEGAPDGSIPDVVREIKPPLAEGQAVVCRRCGRMSLKAYAGPIGMPWTFYCLDCVESAGHRVKVEAAEVNS